MPDTSQLISDLKQFIISKHPDVVFVKDGVFEIVSNPVQRTTTVNSTPIFIENGDYIVKTEQEPPMVLDRHLDLEPKMVSYKIKQSSFKRFLEDRDSCQIQS